MFASTVVVKRFAEDESALCDIVCMRGTMQHNMQLLLVAADLPCQARQEGDMSNELKQIASFVCVVCNPREGLKWLVPTQLGVHGI